MSEELLFVVDTLASGGAGRVVSEVAGELFRQGHHVAVCTFRNRNVVYQLPDGVEHIDGTFGVDKKPGFLQQIRTLHSIIIKRKITCVISFLTPFNVISILAATFTGARVVISERNNPANDKNNVRDALLRRLIYRFANGYVFQTSDIRDWFCSSIRSRSAIIGNPINPLLPEPFNGERIHKIVMSGRLEPQKNYPMAINAFTAVAQDFPDYTLEIYGEGSLRDALQKLIDDNGMTSRILLKGHSSHLFDEIYNASAYLMTSDFEGMSNALMEALGLGLPVISTDHAGGGARTLIRNGVNGMLIPVNDTVILEEKLRQVMKDATLRSTLSNNALQIRSDYAIEHIAKLWMNIIDPQNTQKIQ